MPLLDAALKSIYIATKAVCGIVSSLLNATTGAGAPSQKASWLVRQELPLVKPRCLSEITSLFSLGLSRAAGRICSQTQR